MINNVKQPIVLDSKSTLTKSNNKHRKSVTVWHDSEWIGKHHPHGSKEQIEAHICTQVMISTHGEIDPKILFLNRKYYQPRIVESAFSAGFDKVIEVSAQEVSAGVLFLMKDLINKPLTIGWVFSATDMGYLLGFDNFSEHVQAGRIIRKRCHRLAPGVRELKIVDWTIKTLRDTSGLTSTNWQATLDGLGIPALDKALANKWDKGKMDEILLETPLEFFKYALEDVTSLPKYFEAFLNNINTIRHDLWGFKPWTIEELPHTTGSLVNKNFTEFLNQRIPNLTLARVLTGRWNSDDTMLEDIEKIQRSLIYSHDETIHTTAIKALKKITHGDCISGASTPSLATEYLNTTGKYNAIVQGGRCHNERPLETSFTGRIADIDLKGCYGNALTEFDYPIGIPTVYHKAEGNKKITLGEFLQHNESELVPNLWQIVVNGRLKFKQDLVCSKVVEDRDLRKAAISGFGDEIADLAKHEDEEISKIPGIFNIFTQELINGIITDDVITVIKAVSTEQELKQWMDLEVVTATWYPKSLEVDNNEYVKLTAKHYTPVIVIDKSVIDNRYRGWCRVSIGDFIKPLVEKRLEVKKLAKDDPKLKGLDTILKLFINTLYGVIASPYFPIGNTVIANNITARARVGAWMMAKPLDLFQTITDGGTYNCDKVRCLNQNASQFKKPGFDTLYNRPKWEDVRKGRGYKPLSITIDGVDPWTSPEWFASENNSKKVGDVLDDIGLQHINDFWDIYGIKLKFEVEHKGENTSTNLATYGKADYAYIPIGSETIKYKIRGAKDLRNDAIKGNMARIHTLDEDNYETPKSHPKYAILTALISGLNEITPDLTYHSPKIQSVNDWLSNPKMQDLVLPGQMYHQRATFHILPTHLHFETWEQAEGFLAGKYKPRAEEVEWVSDLANLPTTLSKWQQNPKIRLSKSKP
jgi:hypothetical protein